MTDQQRTILAASVRELGNLGAGLMTATAGAREGEPADGTRSGPGARSEAGQPGPPPWLTVAAMRV